MFNNHNTRLYVDFHVIQTVPPSCVNRDDANRAKTAMYGGVTRARVSSQSWKHAIRKMFKSIFDEDKLGFRTMPKYAAEIIANKLISSGLAPEDAQKRATKALNSVITKAKDTDKNKKNKSDDDVSEQNESDNTNEKQTNKKEALLFISTLQLEKFAELILNGVDPAKDKKQYKDALQKSPSIDIALFGRMVAADAELNVDAACQVAHSISTHAVQTEYDFFTADDDCSPVDSAAAGHLGTLEFNSSTLYRYATVNVMDLSGLIGKNDIPAAIAGFAEAFIRSMPTGKQNSYANRTLPDLIYITIREDQPVNFSGAFEKPIKGNDGFVKQSEKALFDYAEKIYKDYCGSPKYSFVVGYDEILGAEKKDINGLLESLSEIVAKEVQ